MSRLFKGYASNYRANQTQAAQVRRTQTRTIVVDFYGAMTPGDTVASVTWECTSPWITTLSNADVSADGRAVSVECLFNFSGYGCVKATATTVAGDVLNYEFEFTVTDAPLYPSATYSQTQGPFSVTATA